MELLPTIGQKNLYFKIDKNYTKKLYYTPHIHKNYITPQNYFLHIYLKTITFYI